MKRSLHVAAPLVATTALALLTGCRKPEMQRCVDEQNHVVAESFCQANGVRQQPGERPGGMGFYPMPMYRYYYGGGGGWNMGESVFGGSYAAMPGRSYTTSSSVPHASTGTTRGGFGSTHGGGEAGSGHGSSSGGQ